MLFSYKKKEGEESSFSYKRIGQFCQQSYKELKESKFKEQTEGSYQTSGAQQNCDKRCHSYQQINGLCFVCGKQGHYARNIIVNKNGEAEASTTIIEHVRENKFNSSLKNESMLVVVLPKQLDCKDDWIDDLEENVMVCEESFWRTSQRRN